MEPRPTPRAMKKFHLSVGLMTIPVSMASANDAEEKVGLNKVHSKCETQITMPAQCAKCKIEVPADEIVMGYKLADGTFAVVTKEALAEMYPESESGIKIDSVIKRDVIQPHHVRMTYLIYPTESTVNEVFAVFREALRTKNYGAVIELVMFNRKNTCVLVPYDNGMQLLVLHPAAAIRPINIVKGYDSIPSVADKNLTKIAGQILDAIYDEEFTPDNVVDSYNEDLRKLVDELAAKKLRGETGAAPKAEKPKAKAKAKNPTSLDAILAESLKHVEAGGKKKKKVA